MQLGSGIFLQSQDQRNYISNARDQVKLEANKSKFDDI